MFVQKALRVGIVLLVVGAGLAGLSPAIISTARPETAPPPEIGPDARDALARMGKTLSAKEFSYRARTLRSYTGPNGQLLHIEHTMKTIYRRPDHLLVNVTGDDGSIAIVYDGKNLVLYAVEAKQYVRIPMKGDIEQALNFLAERTGTDYPLADLLDDNPEQAVTAGFTAGGQVGTALIDGVRCRHFFFEQATDDLDVELWLEDNERALPRRFVVAYRSLPGRPIFVADLFDWDFSIKTPDSEFVFRPPAGVTQVELKQGGRTVAPK
jgi:hypothetical protein